MNSQDDKISPKNSLAFWNVTRTCGQKQGWCKLGVYNKAYLHLNYNIKKQNLEVIVPTKPCFMGKQIM